MVGLLREKLSLYYFSVSLQFLAKEDQGFAVLFGILVDSCVDGVFLNVLVSFFMWFISFLYFCTLNKWSVKVRIHACHALLLSLFNFNVFYCLKRIQSYCLLSLALSPVIPNHPPQSKASILSPTSPQRTPCRNCVQSPHPKLPSPQFATKNPKNPKSTLLISLLA